MFSQYWWIEIYITLRIKIRTLRSGPTHTICRLYRYEYLAKRSVLVGHVYHGTLRFMITSSHLVYSWAFGRVSARGSASVYEPGRVPAFVLGGVLPDLPVYLLFIVEGLLLGTSQAVIWSEKYFASAWTPWIEASHSFLLWGAVALAGYALSRGLLAYFGLSGLLHGGHGFLCARRGCVPALLAYL